MNTAGINTGIWFVSEMISGIKRDRSSFRTPAQMSKNIEETDFVPYLWIGGLALGFTLLLVIKISYLKE